MTSFRLKLAVASAAAGLAWTAAASAQTLPPIPDASSTQAVGGVLPVITVSADDRVMDIDLHATRTVIFFSDFHISAADTVEFHFASLSDILLIVAPSIEIDADAHLPADASGSPGGNVWFYSALAGTYSPHALYSPEGQYLAGQGFGIVGQDFLAAADPRAFLTAASNGPLQQLVAVPEPQGWALMILGFGAIGAAARRRKAAPAVA